MSVNQKALHKWKEYISAGQVESFTRKPWVAPNHASGTRKSFEDLKKGGTKPKNACEYSTKQLLPLHKSERDHVK